jgi:tRNA(Ile)-lysidine synthase
MEELVRRTRLAAEQERLWRPGDGIVVAVSGGPDSTALLHVLHVLSAECGIRVIAAHANHGFRPEESALEAEHVREWCAALGITCVTAELDVPAAVAAEGGNAQSVAREKRYAFLHETAAAHDAASIALAHHADDQAETVLMRLLRGTGLTGLSGMALKRREKNVELIRPFLRMKKSDIIRYCEAAGLAYCVDSSNAKTVYFRNSVRHDVLPMLERYNPNIAESLVRLAEISAEESDYLDREAEAAFRAKVRVDRHGCTLERQALLDLHVALQRRLIKLILNYLALEKAPTAFERIEGMRRAASDDSPSTAVIEAGMGIRCIREYDTLRWTNDSGGQAPAAYEYIVGPEAGSLLIPEASARLAIARMDLADAHRLTGREEAVFDAEGVAFPLIIRNRRPGDRMRVIGLNGTKKVQDMFVDGKVAPAWRDRVPLVWDAEGRLLWIPGVRRSSIAPVAPGSSSVIRMTFEHCVAEQG